MITLKDVRLISLMLIVLAAAALIAAPYAFQSGKLTVSYVDPAVECNINEGDVINQIYSTGIIDMESFDRALRDVKQGDIVTMVVNGGPFTCVAIADNSIGVTLQEEKFQTLHFGIDIEGGTRVILKPETDITRSQLTETVQTLENRINFYGLKEVKVNTLGSDLIQIEMAGATGDEIRDFLARQGKFTGKLSESVRIFNGTGMFKIGNNTYDVELDDGDVLIQNRRRSINETFTLENETFQIVSVTNTSVNVYADLFTGEDVVNVLSSQGGVGSVGNGLYEFSFGVQITKDAADRFAKLTKGKTVVRTTDQNSYIEPKLVLFLDEQLITELNIASDLAGKSITTATISGTGNTFEEASQEKLKLESTLRSGSLPVKLEIQKVDTITQTAGKELINSTIIVAIGAVIAVSGIVSYRYRDYRLVVPMIIISLSEIVIVLGMATSQIFAGIVIAAAVIIGIWKREIVGIIGWITMFVMMMAAATIVMTQWTIDIPVIAGLIAILGTGVNQMIIMSDQLFREKGRSLPERHKSAMHIIWSSAAIVVFAMVPLILGGIGSLKGFAIATIVGVLVGILITRPAYVAIVEKVKRVQLESV